MKNYVEVKTNLGEYTVEISTGDWNAARYTVWTDTGENVADGVYQQAYDSLREVAEQVVENYISELAALEINC